MLDQARECRRARRRTAPIASTSATTTCRSTGPPGSPEGSSRLLRRRAGRWRRSQRPEADRHRSAQRDDAADDRAGAGSCGAAIADSSGNVAARRSRRASGVLGGRARARRLLVASACAPRRPSGDAAHHHALEHGLAADGSVAAGGQPPSEPDGVLAVRPAARPRRTPRPAACERPCRYCVAARAAAARPLATRRWKRSTRPPVSISFWRPV